MAHQGQPQYSTLQRLLTGEKLDLPRVQVVDMIPTTEGQRTLYSLFDGFETKTACLSLQCKIHDVVELMNYEAKTVGSTQYLDVLNMRIIHNPGVLIRSDPQMQDIHRRPPGMHLQDSAYSDACTQPGVPSAAASPTPLRQAQLPRMSNVELHGLHSGADAMNPYAKAYAQPAPALPPVAAPAVPAFVPLALSAPPVVPAVQRNPELSPQRPPSWTPQGRPQGSPEARAMPLGSPLRVGNPGQGEHISVEQLSTAQRRWKLVARVTKKGDLRQFKYKAKDGSGKMFSIDLLDKANGQTRGTFFGEAADRFFSLIEEGKVYELGNGSVKKADPKYCSFAHEITFNENSTVAAVDDAVSLACPQNVYSFVSVASILSIEPAAIVDIAAVVTECEPPTDVNLKAGGSKKRMNMTLLDDSLKSVRVSLWGDSCDRRYEEGTVVFLKGFKVSDYGGRSLNSVFTSSFCVAETTHPRAQALAGWYASSGSLAKQMATSMTTGGERSDKVQTIEEMKAAAQLEADGKACYHTVVPATMTYLQEDKPHFYLSCPHELTDEKGGKRPCNKKTEPEGNMWRCSAEHVTGSYKARWMLSFAIADHTGSHFVSTFDEVGAKIMGCDASRAAELWARKDTNTEAADELTKVMKAASYGRWRLRLRSKLENWNDEDRLKFTVIEGTQLDFCKDGRAKLQEVMASIASLSSVASAAVA